MYLSINIEHELFLALRNGWNNNNKVFKSTDLGNSWTNLSTDIFDGERIVNIQVQEGTDGGVYVTSKNKVWYRNNSHLDWQMFTEGLPKNFQIAKILSFYRDGKIRIAGTRGIWERDFFEISKMTPSRTVTIDGPIDFLSTLPIKVAVSSNRRSDLVIA